MNPYTILGIIALVIAAAFGGAHVGKKLERQEWQKKEIAALAGYLAQQEADALKYERMVKFNNAKTRKASEEHEKDIALLAAKHAATVSDIRRAGGLRISGTVCKVKDPAATASAGAVESDAETAGTVRLPEQVENRLFGIVEDADNLARQLDHLQKWIRDNGLYGPAAE